MSILFPASAGSCAARVWARASQVHPKYTHTLSPAGRNLEDWLRVLFWLSTSASPAKTQCRCVYFHAFTYLYRFSSSHGLDSSEHACGWWAALPTCWPGQGGPRQSTCARAREAANQVQTQALETTQAFSGSIVHPAIAVSVLRQHLSTSVMKATFRHQRIGTPHD